MSDIVTYYPNQTKWLLNQLPGPVMCGKKNPDIETVTIRNCKLENYCLMRGTDWVNEMCLRTPDEFQKMKYSPASFEGPPAKLTSQQTQFANLPNPQTNKNKVVRVRLPYNRRRHEHDYSNIKYEDQILGVDLWTPYPDRFVQLMNNIGKADCGPNHPPTKMTHCPQHRLCKMPGEHEICIHGPDLTQSNYQMTSPSISHIGFHKRLLESQTHQKKSTTTTN